MTDVLEMLSRAMELPIGQFTGRERLTDIEAWNSLAILNFMALVDTSLGITLSADKLLRCESISDVETLIESSAKRP